MGRSIPEVRPWRRASWRRSALASSVFLLAIVGAGGGTGGCSRCTDGESAAATPARGKAPAGTSSPRPGAKTENPGETSCATCHEEQHRFWAYGAHSGVACQECHEVSGDHVKAEIQPHTPGNKHCLSCHPLVDDAEGRGMAEPEIFERHLRFVEKKHVIQVNREKVKGRCVYCHDPHLGR